MGWRFRKSINIGGTRINFSKSGVGFSYKFLGFGHRITHTARGTTRRTYSIHGTGLSYVTETSNRKASRKKVSVSPSAKTPKEAEYYDEKTIRSSVNKDATAEEFAELRDFVSDVRTKNAWIVVGIVLFGLLGCSFWPLLFVFALMIFLKLKINDYGVVEVECPEMSKGSENEKLRLVKKAIDSKRIRGISKTANYMDSRYSAGAAQGFGFKSCSRIKKLPFPFVFKGDEANKARMKERLVGIKIGSEKAIFLSDFLLYDNGKTFLFLDYNDVKVKIEASKFVERGFIPSDSKVVDYTYQYVNQDNTPDKRFSNNHRIPVCLYGNMTISSASGLNMMINFSDSSVFDGYYEGEVRDTKYNPTDPTVRKAVKLIIEKNKFSVAMLQTYLGEGHGYVTGLAIWLEENGIIGETEGKNKPRKVLVSSMEEFDALFKKK